MSSRKIHPSLSGAYFKFRAAVHQMTALDHWIESYLENSVSHNFVQNYNGSGAAGYLLKATKWDEINSIAVNDIFRNFRESLDYSCASVFTRIGGDEKKLKSTFFPFGDTRGEVANWTDIRFKGLKADWFKDIILDEVQPWKDGTKELWQLNKLSNFSKHRGPVFVPALLTSALPNVRGRGSVVLSSGFQLHPPYEQFFPSEKLAQEDEPKPAKFNLMIDEPQIGLSCDVRIFLRSIESIIQRCHEQIDSGLYDALAD